MSTDRTLKEALVNQSLKNLDSRKSDTSTLLPKSDQDIELVKLKKNMQELQKLASAKGFDETLTASEQAAIDRLFKKKPKSHWCGLRNMINKLKAVFKYNTEEPDRCKSCTGISKCRAVFK